MKKPMIGVTPLYDDALESVWMLPGYLKGVQAAGGIPVIVSFSDSEEEIGEIARQFDGFLFTGGQDVSPALYGQEKLACCGATSPLRDSLEKALFAQAIERGKPVLGICRGLQCINAVLGGTLYQDIETQMPSSGIVHSQKKPYHMPVHSVRVCRDTPLHALAGQGETRVNSLHHQGVCKLADSLRTAAASPDGLVEAAYMPSERFVLAVQWHPEFMYFCDALSLAIFGAFVSACQ